jgi:hypothetical protein
MDLVKCNLLVYILDTDPMILIRCQWKKQAKLLKEVQNY